MNREALTSHGGDNSNFIVKRESRLKELLFTTKCFKIKCLGLNHGCNFLSFHLKINLGFSLSVFGWISLLIHFILHSLQAKSPFYICHMKTNDFLSDSQLHSHHINKQSDKLLFESLENQRSQNLHE